MKILHTSDWHLGRQFHGQSLEDDHAEILEQVLGAVRKHEPNVLIIAGDIYDRASPPTSAVRQFNGFIKRVATQSETAIVMIAGNHDSGDRIESIATLADRNQTLIRGSLFADERPLILKDEHGLVAFSALPFGNEFSARECFDDTSISNPEDVLAAQVRAARAHVPDGARWVITAHAFVTNSSPSDSERRLVVGGVETVAAEIFEGAHYIALGHLHRPQPAGAEHIRYSGSPLAFGFDETDTQKSMTLVELAHDGRVTTTLIPFVPVRSVRTLKGRLADLVATGSISEDFIKIVLTDPGALIDPMGQVREIYPNAMVLSYERDENQPETKSTTVAQSPLDNPQHVVTEFLEYVRGQAPDVNERLVIDTGLKVIAREEART
ncbi:exonuclease SbcCD subunit D [Pelagibius sp. Alg239-R121]|uniref:exonuclease SbcCD subunit D n=1 Tax=Pelagibius sp. Alg239-R121 TaxID=2993448 RepID=UPI0024A79C82|nr:exonuclease SbcCD subunit D [Pelagibius sp. Alg239-R121]